MPKPELWIFCNIHNTDTTFSALFLRSSRHFILDKSTQRSGRKCSDDQVNSNQVSDLKNDVLTLHFPCVFCSASDETLPSCPEVAPVEAGWEDHSGTQRTGKNHRFSPLFVCVCVLVLFCREWIFAAFMPSFAKLKGFLRKMFAQKFYMLELLVRDSFYFFKTTFFETCPLYVDHLSFKTTFSETCSFVFKLFLF